MKKNIHFFILITFFLSGGHAVFSSDIGVSNSKPIYKKKRLPYDSITDDKSFYANYAYVSSQLGGEENIPLYNAYHTSFLQICDWAIAHDLKDKKKIIERLESISDHNKDLNQRIVLGLCSMSFIDKSDKFALAKRYFHTAYTYTLLEKYTEAMVFYNKNIVLLKDEKDIKLQEQYWITYRELGGIYYNLENYQQALYCFQYYYLHDAHSDSYYGPSCLNDIGQCYKNLGQKDSAVTYWNKALQAIAKDTGYQRENQVYKDLMTPIINANFFDYAVQNKNYSYALKLARGEYHAGVQYSEAFATARGLYKIAESYYYLKNWDSFYHYFTLYIDYPSLGNTLKPKLKIYRHKLSADVATHNYNEIQWDIDKIAQYENALTKRMSEYYNQFVLKTNYKMTQEELALANDKLVLAKTNDHYKNIILALVSLLTVGSIYYYIKARNKNKEIGHQKQIIEQENNKQKILLKEIHHRVKNNLQLISSYLQLQMTKANAKDNIALQDSIKNIETIALVHENLYKKENLDRVNIRSYIEALSQNTLTISHHSNIAMQVKIDEIYLDIDSALGLGLIINELITNSLKYAFPNGYGNIEINIMEDNHKIRMRYRDHGKGVSREQLESKKSIGIRMIESIAGEDLRGTYRYLLDRGFGFELEFDRNQN